MKTLKEKLCLEKPEYKICVCKKSVTFLWTCEPGNFYKSALDLKVKVPAQEIVKIAEELGCNRVGSKIFIPNLDIYNRLMIYAAVRPKVRSVSGLRELRLVIEKMNGWHAHYWASGFREIWWAHRNYRSMFKAVKAFKLFFEIN